MSDDTARPQSSAPIKALVPMIRVSDVERSAQFYQLLDFRIGNYEPHRTPPKHWAWLFQPGAANWKTGANLMLIRSESKLEADPPIVLYLYAVDLVALRQQLIDGGINVGSITYPSYLPRGEFELHDPDGYTVMIAQSDDGTP